MSILNSFCNGETCPSAMVIDQDLQRVRVDIFERICGESAKLATYSKKSTISSREIQVSYSLGFPSLLF